MELPTLWSCSTNEGGALEHLFCCSRTTQYLIRFGGGGLLLTNATDYIKKTVHFFLQTPPTPPSPRTAQLLCPPVAGLHTPAGHRPSLLPLLRRAALARTSSATSRTSCCKESLPTFASPAPPRAPTCSHRPRSRTPSTAPSPAAKAGRRTELPARRQGRLPSGNPGAPPWLAAPPSSPLPRRHGRPPC